MVALAAALRVIGTYVLTRGGGDGYFAYVEDVYPAQLAAGFLWLALIAVWAAASVWLLGGSRRSE